MSTLDASPPTPAPRPPRPAAGGDVDADPPLGARAGKRVAEEVLAMLPADASVDDVLRALAFHRMVYRGLAQVATGDTTSHEDLRRRLRSWAS